jgi:wyosine [tRNA(Phe)-imidazoG37] synthetase (radical SAM superfamily)
MLLPLKQCITYGPVPSRRLGRSLGINLSPAGRKLCSFDCQYCQYGFAPPVATASGAEDELPTPLQVEQAVATRTAILSNSSEVGRAETRAALSRLDARIMKLDAGTEAAFAAYNQPAPGRRLETIVDGLAQLGGVTLQALFTDGPQGNLADFDAWLATVAQLRPIVVQLYTLDRESPNRGLRCATQAHLQAVSGRLGARGIAATVNGR